MDLLYVSILICGALTIVMSFGINPKPSFSPGWLLIILGIETMVAGITGIGGTNLPCCYVSHIILMSISIFGIGVFALAIIAEVDKFLSQVCWAYLFLCGVEVCGLVGRCLFQRLSLGDFQTIDQIQESQKNSLGKVRHELDERNERVERTNATNIGDKMKEKYAR
ncbi:unnamed protein product [Sphagnum troendelagicum]|uniref:Uncharacterized protein n=1 Tax=Sphagnum troendelagicum TaxID=128251 RepID=A0ABP0V495_9BRYO